MDLNEWKNLIAKETYFGKIFTDKKVCIQFIQFEVLYNLNFNQTKHEFSLNEMGEFRNFLRRIFDLSEVIFLSDF